MEQKTNLVEQKKMSPQQAVLQKVYNNLTNFLTEKTEALPRNFNQTRFIQNCMAVLQDTKDIEKVQPISIARAFLKGAFLGLDFFRKEAYVIVYNENIGTRDKPNWIKTAQFQTDYKGERKLVKKYSVNPVLDIYAKLVREDDELEICIEDGRQKLNFRPKPFNDNPIIGAFAVVLYKDGSIMYEAMSVKEIEFVRDNYAKKDRAGNFSKAWEISFGELCKKTVYRRLCKSVDLEFESKEQHEAFNESSEFNVEEAVSPMEKKKVINPFEEPEISTAELVERDPGQEG